MNADSNHFYVNILWKLVIFRFMISKSMEGLSPAQLIKLTHMDTMESVDWLAVLFKVLSNTSRMHKYSVKIKH